MATPVRENSVMRVLVLSWVLVAGVGGALAEEAHAQRATSERATRVPLVRTVDLDLGEEQQVTLHDGTTATVRLLDMKAERDAVIGAVRRVRVTAEVNGQRVRLTCGNYELPRTVAGVQADVPVTGHYPQTGTEEAWGLQKDARLRLWPAGSPWIAPGTFVYPVGQRWLASETWYANEPVRAREEDGKIYYHDGMDLGGAEDRVEVFAAAGGRVVSVGGTPLTDRPHPPVSERYDVVYILGARGWYYRYSHLDRILPGIELGATVQAGQPLGTIGKEGASGGWSHLHFEIVSRQPSGRWGTLESYAFLWQAYRRQYDPAVVALARPRRWAYTGETVTLDGASSWARGTVARYAWTLADGTTATGPVVTHRYEQPGRYSEILEVTDQAGRVDYDFTTVRIFDKGAEGRPPSVHAAYAPTFDVAPGEAVTFKVRAGHTTGGYEVWDFGDGSVPDTTRSNADLAPHAERGYATTTHRYEAAGHYIVTVRRTNAYGTGTDRLHVVVESPTTH